MSTLSVVVEDGVTVVRMDDGKANALSMQLLQELLAALTDAEARGSALVLMGRPERFCAGFDLKVMMSSPEAATGLLRRGTELLMRLYGSPIPVVAACTGHALAGGALVLCTADVRLGIDGPYRIGLNEVSIGLPVPILALELARARVQPMALTAATLFSEIYDPAGAERVGFLDQRVPAEALLAQATAHARRLAALPAQAYAATKTRLRGPTIAHIWQTLEQDLAAILPGK